MTEKIEPKVENETPNVVTETAIQKTSEIKSPIYASTLKMKDYIQKVNCKLCNHELRLEAEKEFDRTGNAKAVQAFLKGKGVTTINYSSIWNHLTMHYIKVQRQLRLKEWAEDLPMLMEQQHSRREALQEQLAILRNEFANIAMEAEGLGIDDRRKNADVMKKLSDSILAIEDKIYELDKKIEPVFVVIERLEKIISTRIKESKNEEVKREFMIVLDLLGKSLEDLKIEN